MRRAEARGKTGESTSEGRVQERKPRPDSLSEHTPLTAGGSGVLGATEQGLRDLGGWPLLARTRTQPYSVPALHMSA